MEYKIDAKGKKIGRVSTEAAVLLMGKNTPAFAKNIAPDIKVTIENASKVISSEKKAKEKVYVSYTGYPGGLRKQKMEDVVAKKGIAEVFRLAVYGMLPANRLRSKRMKNLIINE